MSLGQVALINSFKRKRQSEFGSSCSFSDLPKVNCHDISVTITVYCSKDRKLKYVCIQQEMVPHNESVDVKRMKTVDSCAFSVRKSLSTSVLTGTNISHSDVDLPWLCHCFESMLSYACYLTTDKFSCMQRVVAPGGCRQSLEESSEDLKQHFTDSFCPPNNRQYYMPPSAKHRGQFLDLTLRYLLCFCSNNLFF